MIPWAYAGGTLLYWSALTLVLRGLFLLVRHFVNPPGLDRTRSSKATGLAFGLAAVGLLLGNVLAPQKSVGVPIVWPVLSVQALLSLVCAVFAVYGLVKIVMTGSIGGAAPKTAPAPGLAALAWGVASALCWLLPRANPVPLQILTGSVAFNPSTAIAVAALAVAAVVAMATASKSTKSKRLFKIFSTQIALMAGVVVFGLPFLFLLVTSFKEDRDMSSVHGIIWVPRVIQTAPVLDDEYPFYEADYKGIRVTADKTGEKPGGIMTLTIEHPVYFGGYSFDIPVSKAKRIPRDMELVAGELNGVKIEGVIFRKLPDGSRDVEIRLPANLKGQRHVFAPKETDFVRPVSLRWKNYVEALEFLPPEANYGLTYLKNTLWLVIMNTLGALVSCSLVAYAFARLRFPGREVLFKVMLSTMMLPTAVTLLPQFLIFREFGWINSLKPMWVTSWFAAAFNVFLMRQFFEQIPFELEDAAKIDGCNYLKSLWSVMLPQVKPALAVIAIMTFMGAWNNFMGPLVYSSSPETLPISYAVQLFNGERNGDPGLLMAFVTMSLAPVIALFFFAQRFFIEGVTLSGLGGR